MEQSREADAAVAAAAAYRACAILRWGHSPQADAQRYECMRACVALIDSGPAGAATAVAHGKTALDVLWAAMYSKIKPVREALAKAPSARTASELLDFLVCCRDVCIALSDAYLVRLVASAAARRQCCPSVLAAIDAATTSGESSSACTPPRTSAGGASAASAGGGSDAAATPLAWMSPDGAAGAAAAAATGGDDAADVEMDARGPLALRFNGDAAVPAAIEAMPVATSTTAPLDAATVEGSTQASTARHSGPRSSQQTVPHTSQHSLASSARTPASDATVSATPGSEAASARARAQASTSATFDFEGDGAQLMATCSAAAGDQAPASPRPSSALRRSAAQHAPLVGAAGASSCAVTAIAIGGLDADAAVSAAASVDNALPTSLSSSATAAHVGCTAACRLQWQQLVSGSTGSAPAVATASAVDSSAAGLADAAASVRIFQQLLLFLGDILRYTRSHPQVLDAIERRRVGSAQPLQAGAAAFAADSASAVMADAGSAARPALLTSAGRVLAPAQPLRQHSSEAVALVPDDDEDDGEAGAVFADAMPARSRPRPTASADDDAISPPPRKRRRLDGDNQNVDGLDELSPSAAADIVDIFGVQPLPEALAVSLFASAEGRRSMWLPGAGLLPGPRPGAMLMRLLPCAASGPNVRAAAPSATLVPSSTMASLPGPGELAMDDASAAAAAGTLPATNACELCATGTLAGAQHDCPLLPLPAFQELAVYKLAEHIGADHGPAHHKLAVCAAAQAASAAFIYRLIHGVSSLTPTTGAIGSDLSQALAASRRRLLQLAGVAAGLAAGEAASSAGAASAALIRCLGSVGWRDIAADSCITADGATLVSLARAHKAGLAALGRSALQAAASVGVAAKGGSGCSAVAHSDSVAAELLKLSEGFGSGAGGKSHKASAAVAAQKAAASRAASAERRVRRPGRRSAAAAAGATDGAAMSVSPGDVAVAPAAGVTVISPLTIARHLVPRSILVLPPCADEGARLRPKTLAAFAIDAGSVFAAGAVPLKRAVLSLTIARVCFVVASLSDPASDPSSDAALPALMTQVSTAVRRLLQATASTVKPAGMHPAAAPSVSTHQCWLWMVRCFLMLAHACHVQADARVAASSSSGAGAAAGTASSLPIVRQQCALVVTLQFAAAVLVGTKQAVLVLLREAGVCLPRHTRSGESHAVAGKLPAAHDHADGDIDVDVVVDVDVDGAAASDTALPYVQWDRVTAQLACDVAHAIAPAAVVCRWALEHAEALGPPTRCAGESFSSNVGQPAAPRPSFMELCRAGRMHDLLTIVARHVHTSMVGLRSCVSTVVKPALMKHASTVTASPLCPTQLAARHMWEERECAGFAPLGHTSAAVGGAVLAPLLQVMSGQVSVAALATAEVEAMVGAAGEAEDCPEATVLASDETAGALAAGLLRCRAMLGSVAAAL